MAISAVFCKNNKKINSTKLPVAAADDIALDVELKSVTNLFTPTLIISTDVFMSGGSVVNPMQYNYCHLPDFNRYYFIRSWSWVSGRWECSLEVDVLASFKTEIGETSALVLRTASNIGWNGDIIDTKYPTCIKGLNGDKRFSPHAHPWSVNIKNASMSEGFYRVSISNNDASAVGGVSHYAFSAAAMQELMNKLFSSPSWMNITDANISQDLQKMMFDPMQYIVSCIWIPYGYSFTAGVTSVPIGWWSITLSNTVYRIDASNSLITVPTIQFPRPNHPNYDASKRRWVHLSPYTTCALYFPPFGYIPLDMSKMYECTGVQCSVNIDVITGRGTLFVTAYNTFPDPPFVVDNGVIYTDVAQVGVPISLTQMSVDWNALSSASTWAASAGISLAVGGLQEGLNNLSSGLVNGAKTLFSKVNDLLDKYSPTRDAKRALTRIVDRVQWTASVMADDPSLWSPPSASSGGETSLLSSIKEIAGDIGSTALAASGTCQSSGSSGGFASLVEPLFIEYFYQTLVGIDDVHNGIPCGVIVQIKRLSGFVLCGNTDEFTANCTQAERQAVRALMEAGFYYE